MDDKDKTQVSTSSSTMWKPLESAWGNILGQAQTQYNQNIKKAPQLQPLNNYSTEALNMTANLARQPVQGLGSAFGYTDGLLKSGGMTPEMQQAAGFLQPFASGQYQEDPRLVQMLNTNATRAADAAATRFGGGRYGSAAIGNGVGTAVADANNATMLQSNENARSRQLQATGLLGQLGDSAAGNAMQASAMLPALNNLQYDGASRLAGVGDFFQQRAQTNADYKRNYKNDALAAYAGLAGGMGNLGGTTVTTTPKQSPSLAQGILGGAASGAAIGSKIPGIGGGWGALAGGILGGWA